MHDLLLLLLLLCSVQVFVSQPSQLHLCCIQEMKSIGAEVNWGVRLNSSKDVGFVLCIIYPSIVEFLWGTVIGGVIIVLNLCFPESRLPVKTM